MPKRFSHIGSVPESTREKLLLFLIPVAVWFGLVTGLGEVILRPRWRHAIRATLDRRRESSGQLE